MKIPLYSSIIKRERDAIPVQQANLCQKSTYTSLATSGHGLGRTMPMTSSSGWRFPVSKSFIPSFSFSGFSTSSI